MRRKEDDQLRLGLTFSGTKGFYDQGNQSYRASVKINKAASISSK